MIAILAAEEIDTTAVTIALVASVGLIALNGFYVAYEFAVLAAKRSSFEDESRRPWTSRAARASLSDVSMQLAGAQLGITMASLALGRISEPALESVIERAIGGSLSPEMTTAVGISLSLGIFTVLHLIFGEMVPKNIALVAPDATLRWLVVPYRFYLFLFRPIVTFLNGIANLASRAVGIQPRDELQSVHTTSELAVIVAHSSAGGAIDADDAELLQGALDFAQRPVSEVATPLAEHPAVALGATVGQFERAVASTGYGRVLVRDGDATPIGYIHARDLLEVDQDQRSAPMPVDYVRNMAVVQADQSLIEVLVQLRRLKRYLAVVQTADGPIGVVTQEQVVAAIIQPTAAQTSSPSGGEPDTEPGSADGTVDGGAGDGTLGEVTHHSG